MKLIVGLGNPEIDYDLTRHNIGFMCLNSFAYKNNLKFNKKFNGYYCDVYLNGEKIVLLKPDTYMNLSGEAVNKFINFFEVDLEDVLIIYDDLALDFNKIKLKQNSSSGGHNGIKSIISHLKTEEFLRIKVGINNEYKKDTKSFVLNRFSKKEQVELEYIYEIVNSIIYDFIKGNSSNELMNKYN